MNWSIHRSVDCCKQPENCITRALTITEISLLLCIFHYIHDNYFILAMSLLIEYYWNTWRYSNAPEGEKPLEKVIGLSKYGFLTGLGVGTYDCILLSQAYTFWHSVNCLSYWVLPFTAMCATFASVAYTTTKLRGKDGYANYFAACM